MSLWSDLIGTSADAFAVGFTGFILKNSSGKLIVRNAADSEDAIIEALKLQLKESGDTSVITIQAPSLAGDWTLTLPADAGSAGFVLSTDGSGVTTWVAPSSNGILLDKTAYTDASGTLAMFTPPANAKILKVVNHVLTATSGGSPTLSVGISGNVAKYMATARSNMKAVADYEANPNYDEDGSPDAIIGTIVASSQTFTGELWVYYSVAS